MPTPAPVGKGIKKQYSCQQETFAERLNPHSAARLSWAGLTPPCPAPPGQTGGPTSASLRSPWQPTLEGQKRACSEF